MHGRVLWVALLAMNYLSVITPVSADGPATLREYDVTSGRFAIDIPANWRETVDADNETGLYLKYMPKTGVDFSVQITILSNPSTKARFDVEWARKQAFEAARELPLTIVEDQIVVSALPMFEAPGYYYSVTDKNATPDPGDYPHMTQGFAALGEAGLMFTILSNEPDATPVSEALSAISGARFTTPGAEVTRNLTIQDVMIDPQAVSPECTLIDGDHGYSMQARLRYSSERSDVPLVDKAMQSFECGKHKGTVYYYQFPPFTNMERRRELMGLRIWGGRRPNYHHPERILTIDTVLIVVSSKKPKALSRYFSSDLSR